VGIANRIADIDGLVAELGEVGLDKRVLSAPPALVTPDGVPLAMSSIRAMNEHLAEVVATHRGSLVGLATIDAFQGDEAAAEVGRATDELGFRGVVIDCARGDLLLDAPEARPFLTVAAARKIPVFAHPMSPARLSGELRALGNWGRALARGTASSASLFSLIASGLFDELSGLRIVFAWLGGGAFPVAGTVPGSERLRKETPDDERWHVYVDTMGFEPSGVRYAVDLLGADHVLTGSDWPIGSVTASRERVATTLDAAGLNAHDQELVSWGNAASLLQFTD
jgi:predicted TIM-barrel fold metal-dependent hydrolase